VVRGAERFYMRRLRDDLIYIRNPPAGEVGRIDNDAGVGIKGAGTTDSYPAQSANSRFAYCPRGCGVNRLGHRSQAAGGAVATGHRVARVAQDLAGWVDQAGGNLGASDVDADDQIIRRWG